MDIKRIGKWDHIYIYIYNIIVITSNMMDIYLKAEYEHMDYY